VSVEDPEERTEVVTRDVVDARSPAPPASPGPPGLPGPSGPSGPAGQPARLGRYHLDKLIGQGGMAEVFLARPEGAPAGFRVVIKRIRPSLLTDATSKNYVEMFLREARLLASLDHDNIVRILELGIEPPRNGKVVGEHFLAMELLEGLTLRDLAWRHWQAKRPLPIELIVRVVADLCAGLDHAHRMKDPLTGKSAALVHRDVSPDNVFLTTLGVTKLLDFGVAKREGWAGLTTAGELKGKIPFMAPEQLKEEAVDNRTDVFATGVVLYWLLTGRRPFDGPSEVFVMKAILDDPPAPLQTHNPAIPLALDQLVLSCLAKERAARMPSAAALRDSLLALLPPGAGEPIAKIMATSMALPAAERETSPAVASATTLSWEKAIPSEFDDVPSTDTGDHTLEFTVPGVEPPSSPSPSRQRIATSGRVLLVPTDTAPATSEVQRLKAEVARLEEKIVSLSSLSPSASLIGAVGPLLWGLEQAIAHLATPAAADATLAQHVRQLQLLHAVLKRLVDSTEKR
jgi:serine/threonine protein kinase